MTAQEIKKQEEQVKKSTPAFFPPQIIGILAEEVAKTVAQRLPQLIQRPKRKIKNHPFGKLRANIKKIENSLFLDTSAIIDGRVFDVFNLGLVCGNVVILDSVLSELKHIADSQDTVKRERGRKGLEGLEKLKKTRGVKIIVLSDDEEKRYSRKEIKDVDDKLIMVAKNTKSKIMTCDYNLEKKGSIQNVLAININALSNCLKVTAVPGEALHLKILHVGKDISQGVGYLDDGTMVVVENGKDNLGQTIDVVVARVIQTPAGRILFAKKI